LRIESASEKIRRKVNGPIRASVPLKGILGMAYDLPKEEHESMDIA
jgi:hypothetical protein